MHKEGVRGLDSMTLPRLIVFNENLGIVVQYIQSVRHVTKMKRTPSLCYLNKQLYSFSSVT